MRHKDIDWHNLRVRGDGTIERTNMGEVVREHLKKEAEALKQIRKNAKRFKRAPKIGDEAKRIKELEAFVRSIADEDVDDTDIPQDLIEEAHELLYGISGSDNEQRK